MYMLPVPTARPVLGGTWRLDKSNHTSVLTVVKSKQGWLRLPAIRLQRCQQEVQSTEHSQEVLVFATTAYWQFGIKPAKMSAYIGEKITDEDAQKLVSFPSAAES